MIRLSKREEEVMKILGKKAMSLEEIAKVFYKSDLPFDASNLMGNIVRRIRRKCEFDKKTDWTILDETYEGNTKLFYVGRKK